MLPAETLKIWSAACQEADLSWFLYTDTLLCATGYRNFPDTLQSAQVVVFAADLNAVFAQVFPILPKEWTLNINAFATENNAICFMQNGIVVLEVYILYALEDRNQAEKVLEKSDRIRVKARTKIKLLSMLRDVLGRTFEKIIACKCDRIEQKAFDALCSIAQSNDRTLPFYCDHLTNRHGMILPKEHFAETETLICNGTAYPVFSNHRDYLTEVYGDYEKGLFDEIGCSLTAEDKIALKEHQERCKEALLFVKNLSEELDLRYYLLAGSVLGPVRDGGFIPWDDDIDIGIRIEELARFEELVKEHLPSRLPKGFTLMQPGANNPYPRMFSKICYEGRCCMDLWPLVPTYTDGLRAKLTWYFAKIITKVHYKKVGHKVSRFVKLVNLMSFFMSDKMVMWAARYNERKDAKKNTPAYINLYSIYRREKETILREWLDQEATADFDGITVPVVGHTEEYLTHLYGNYMAKPAPWKRASRHVERFTTTPAASAEN